MSIRASQGEAFDITFVLKTKEETPTEITPADVDEVEAELGPLKKYFSDGGILYDDDNDVWIFPVLQEETFKLLGIYGLTARAKYKDDTVGKAGLTSVIVFPTDSRRVL